ncbi:hypothetical protein [Streptomyces sp. NBC_00829]|uniref:hypothetical protein n=1 Tax=Streptomyces sp. NBC_00829 TaxID=2903679 RepID=UPI00386763E8|nr:hypothetical protein OG293_11100 [Streptomyces sp. NBC_00829]
MTDLIRTTLEWVRRVLGGRRAPGRHCRPAPAVALPTALTPDVCGARLAVARRHREARHVPLLPEPRAQWFPPAPWERPMTLVRPYLLCHLGEEWRHAPTGKGA